MKASAQSPARKLLQNTRPLIIGHRGCCAGAPENTLPSIELALEAGVDLVELDYHHNQDGVPMVIHDPTLDRTTNACSQWNSRRIPVAQKTAAEIQSLDAGSWFDAKFAGAKVPLLTEALDFIRGHGKVALIEHKSGDARTLANLLRGRDLINRVMVISFDWKFLRELHELEPAQVLGALGPPNRLASRMRPDRRGLSVRWLNELSKTGAQLVVWNQQVSRPAIQHARERGLQVWTYTINEPKLARRLVEMGVSGIITNHPQAIIPAIT